MATYREMIYMVIDQLKLISDDSYYTEEHILFLLKRMRALILDRKYSNARVTSSVNDADYQGLEIEFRRKDDVRGRLVFESLERIPELTKAGIVIVYPKEGLCIDKMSFIPFERIPYVGNNRWLKDFMYVAYGDDGKLVIVGNQFLSMRIGIRGIFLDPEIAARFEPGYNGNILDWRFPLEDSLHAQCIEMVLQELSGARYAPYDKTNNAADDNGIATKEASSQAPAVATKTGE